MRRRFKNFYYCQVWRLSSMPSYTQSSSWQRLWRSPSSAWWYSPCSPCRSTWGSSETNVSLRSQATLTGQTGLQTHLTGSMLTESQNFVVTQVEQGKSRGKALKNLKTEKPSNEFYLEVHFIQFKRRVVGGCWPSIVLFLCPHSSAWIFQKRNKKSTNENILFCSISTSSPSVFVKFNTIRILMRRRLKPLHQHLMLRCDMQWG